MIRGLTLWGSSRPRFTLREVVQVANGRVVREFASRPGELLPGTFAVTKTVAVIVASESMEEILLPGDAVSVDKAKWYTVQSVSGTSVALSAAVTEDSDLTAQVYFDAGSIWLPHTTETKFRFIPGRGDGGATVVRLYSGEEIRRADGFRVEVGLNWEIMNRFDYEKALLIHAYGLTNSIIVRPHDDVGMEFAMNDLTEIESAFPGGKLVGHGHSMAFRSTTLITDVPRVSNAFVRSGFRPVLGV